MRRDKSALKIWLPLVALVALAWFGQLEHSGTDSGPQTLPPQAVEQAPAEAWKAGQWVQVRATVERLLADDNDGSRHQRFIIAVPGGRTLLVAHNIDLAPRVPLAAGDTLALRGRYEPNARGGVIHWTHHDPDGDTPAGWIEYRGRRYR